MQKIRNKEEFTITDQLLLETILMIIRRETIKYSSYKKKNNEKNEKQLENDIKLLEHNVMHGRPKWIFSRLHQKRKNALTVLRKLQ